MTPKKRKAKTEVLPSLLDFQRTACSPSEQPEIVGERLKTKDDKDRALVTGEEHPTYSETPTVSS